jgi:hypothetical protein
MSENRNATVHEDEMAAIKDSRDRDMPLFEKPGEKPLWVVAVSDHQAKLALVDRIFPLGKYTKRERDDRYTGLLEKALTDTASGSEKQS